MIGKEDGLLEVSRRKEETKIALHLCGIVRLPAESHPGAGAESRYNIIASEKREAFITESEPPTRDAHRLLA